MATKQQVWIVIPADTPALARVFGNQESAEKWFSELFMEYGYKYGLRPEEVQDKLKDVLDTGHFHGRSSKNNRGAYNYTLNSFFVED